MLVNQRIKMLREQNNYTLKEVAKKLGVSLATVQRYESDNGIKAIPYDIIEKLSQIYGVTPSYIMGWEMSDAGDNPELEKLICLAKSFDEMQLKRMIAYFEYFSTHKL